MTLKNGSNEEIVSMFNTYRREVNSIIHTVIQLVYFMRGAISYNEMMNMTYAERDKVNDFITERLEAESKRMTPIY